jgi:hypothetical protein
MRRAPVEETRRMVLLHTLALRSFDAGPERVPSAHLNNKKLKGSRHKHLIQFMPAMQKK